MSDQGLIDMLARRLWLADARRWLKEQRDLGYIEAGGDIDPAQYDELAAVPISGIRHRRIWEGLAREALQATHDHGPTIGLREAIAAELSAGRGVGEREMVEPGWEWVSAWRWFGVYLARSSDGGWEYKGRPLRRVDWTAGRCGDGRQALSVGLVVGEFGASILFDPRRFRKAPHPTGKTRSDRTPQSLGPRRKGRRRMGEDPAADLRRADDMVKRADALEEEAKALRRAARKIGAKHSSYRPPGLVERLRKALDGST